jgi:branched-subunit amino acid transport protein AzlD
MKWVTIPPNLGFPNTFLYIKRKKDPEIFFCFVQKLFDAIVSFLAKTAKMTVWELLLVYNVKEIEISKNVTTFQWAHR